MTPTRRAAIAAGLLLPFSRLSAQELPAVEEGARREGELSWYTAHTDGETAQAMLNAFTAQYPFVKGSVVRTTAQVAYQRLLQDLKNGIRQCDVFSSTDLGHDEALRDANRFVRWTPPNADALRPEFAGLDAGGTYFATLAELVVPIYNTAKVPAAEAPRNWPDFLDPRWRGQVAVGHPAFSGTVGTWVVAMRKLYGWEFFTRLEKNKPLIGRSVNDAVGVLTSGERAVGIGPSGLSQVTAARGNPVGISEARDGAVLIVSPSAIMAEAPHPNCAKLFMNFLLGPAMSRVALEARRVPVRKDVATTVYGKPFEQVKLIRPPTAEIVRDMQEVIEQWRDTFGS